MSPSRFKYIDTLVSRSLNERRNGNFALAWRLLETAHVFSQPFAAFHLFVHWQMFRLAIFEKNVAEIIGQIPRLLLALPASIFRIYPPGNSGRSNVGMFASMAISKKDADKMKELERQDKIHFETDGESVKKRRQHPISRR